MKTLSYLLSVAIVLVSTSASADKPTETPQINVDPTALRVLIATADRMSVTRGEGVQEKSVYDTTDLGDIKKFNDALNPKVPESQYACLCGPTVTIYFYKAGKQITKIEYIAPNEIAVESWNSFTHISRPEDLVDWFSARGISQPEEYYQGYYQVGWKDGPGWDALPVLHKAFPKFEWDYKTAVQADLDGDGNFDVAMLGYTKDKAALGVVTGKKKDGQSIVRIIDFARDGQSERSLGGKSGKLSVHLNDIGAPADAAGALPEGFKECDDCFQIEIQGDGESDPLWIYWDHVTDDLNWWRA